MTNPENKEKSYDVPSSPIGDAATVVPQGQAPLFTRSNGGVNNPVSHPPSQVCQVLELPVIALHR